MQGGERYSFKVDLDEYVSGQELLGIDRRARPCALARDLGLAATMDAAGPLVAAGGADLVYELTGDPAALDLALRLCGDEGRVVVGSWYGNRSAALALGTHFHRGRKRIESSQVSRIGPALSGRWTKARRLGVALDLLGPLEPERLVTHRIALDDAATAYALLDDPAGDFMQVLLTGA